MKIKSQKGAITIIALVSILFLVSFLISSYVLIANRVQAQKEILEQTKKTYEVGDMEQIYNSYFRSESIPIYNAEELVRIGSGDTYMIQNKYYILSENATYILMNNISFNSSDLTYLNGTDWTPIGRTSIKFEGNGKEITVTDQNGIVKKYNKMNKYKYYGNEALASQSDYIESGLVCWLDGSENSSKGGNHSYLATTWTDISQNTNNATITNLKGWGENYLSFGGTSYAFINAISQLGVNRTTNFTVEVVFSSMNYQGQGGILCSGFGSTQAQLRLEQKGSLQGYNSGQGSSEEIRMLGLQNGNMYSVVSKMENSTTQGYYYINGARQSENLLSGIFPSQTSVNDIGLYLGKTFRSNPSILNRYANCKIYAVRIYNRALTEEEIEQNYEVDSQRFSNEIININNASDLINIYNNNIPSYRLNDNINLGQNTTWVPIGRNRDVLDFDGNGKEIRVTTPSGRTKTYNESNEYKYAGTILATESDYVTTGIKCWLDGIQATQNAISSPSTTWIDLSGNNKNATLYNFNSTGSGWYGNHVRFNGTNSYAMISAVLGNNKTANYTVEVVFDSDNYTSSNQGGVFVTGFGYTTAQLRVQLNGVVNAFGGSSTGTTYSYPITNPYNCLTFSVGANSCNFYINGQFKNNGTYAGMSPSAFPNIYLGLARNLKGDVMRYGKVKIYAVRIYNRALSSEEILQNYSVDVQRFGLQ